MIEKINESNLIGEHQNKSISTILDKINEIIDYINPKEIEEKENKIPCGHKNCPRANNGLTYCVQTNDRIREEWNNKLKQKARDIRACIDIEDSVMFLEKFIAELLKSQKEQRTKEILEIIEKQKFDDGCIDIQFDELKDLINKLK